MRAILLDVPEKSGAHHADVLPLTRTVEAHRLVEQGIRGRIVLTP
ncbi:MAG: hypothetical protein ACRD0K_06255 [Egibacteraceae bacterium]